MASQAIGSLFVSLGLDTAVFTAGVKKVQGVTGKLQKSFANFGTAATNLGTKLSVVSAGMAAVGLAGAALVKQTADAAVQIDRQSKIANTSTDAFQRWSAGAKRAGIDQDKLADILKDVNDRVGDFLQTGGGPMADFFEKVAPKVGVTAEQFKNLSGPDALQLYVDTMERAGLSQQDMTFYMEAMASDATALLPLLLNNGKAMREYGNAAASSGAVMSEKLIAASVQFNEKLNVLSERLTGARNQLAEVLLPVINRFLDVLIAQGVPALEKFIGFVEQAIQWFGELPGPVQEAAGAIALALGTGGPILLAVGAVSTAISALIAATGPVGLFIAAAATLGAAWAVWGDDIKAAVGGAIDYITGKFDAFVAKLKAIIEWAGKVKTAVAEALQYAPAGEGGFDPDPYANTPQGQGLINGGNGVTDLDGSAGADMLTQGTEIGGNLATGITNGLTTGLQTAAPQIQAAINTVPAIARSELGIQSPSRVFMEIGNFITQGLGLGISQGTPGVQTAMTGVSDAVIGESDSMSSSMNSFASTAQGAFKSVIDGSKAVGDALRELAATWISSIADNMFNAGWSALTGAIGIGANANGTRDWRGGLTRVNERGGEIMNLPKGTQIIPNDISKRMADRSGGGSNVNVQVVPSPMFEVVVREEAANVTREGISQYDRQMPDRISSITRDGRKRS